MVVLLTVGPTLSFKEVLGAKLLIENIIKPPHVSFA